MKIYIQRNSKVYGPYSRKQVGKYLNDGTLKYKDPAFCSGQWINLGELIKSEQPNIEKRDPASEKAIGELLCNCREFRKLYNKLREFNPLQVLNIERSELVNSSMLFWLLDCKSTHNMNDLFLRRWLIKILRDHGELSEDIEDDKTYSQDLPRPLDLELANLISVEVKREEKLNSDRKIDLFIKVRTEKRGTWQILIENKIKTSQAENQLDNYAEWANHKKRRKKKSILLFLRDRDEKPKGKWARQWIRCDYSQIFEVLTEILQDEDTRIPAEEKTFIEDYKQALSKFNSVGQNELQELAFTVLGSHWDAVQKINKLNTDNEIFQKYEVAWRFLDEKQKSKAAFFASLLKRRFEEKTDELEIDDEIQRKNNTLFFQPKRFSSIPFKFEILFSEKGQGIAFHLRIKVEEKLRKNRHKILDGLERGVEEGKIQQGSLNHITRSEYLVFNHTNIIEYTDDLNLLTTADTVEKDLRGLLQDHAGSYQQALDTIELCCRNNDLC